MADISKIKTRSNGTEYNIKDASAFRTGDTAETTIDNADTIPFYDTSATAKKKITVQNLKSAIGGSQALAGLTDTNITNPLDGQLLGFNGTSGKWENQIFIPSYIQKAVTVYSAPNDTVTYTDEMGTKTVTTDSNGMGLASVAILTTGSGISFTSSVAKNPNNLSQAYSKAFNITNSTVSIYIMPDNVCYWFGYKSSEYQELSSANGWSYPHAIGGGFTAPTESTNYLTCSSPNYTWSGIAFSTSKTGTNEKAIMQGITAVNSVYGTVAAFVSKDLSNESNRILTSYNSDAIGTVVNNISSSTTDRPVFAGTSNNRSAKLYAFWLE